MFKAISLTLLFSALASAQGASDLASLLGATDQLSTLTSVVMGFPSILSTLTGFPTNLTILAPSNAAFEKMLADKSTGLSMAMANNDTEWISTLLTYHVLNGTFFSTAFKEGMTAAGPSLLMDNEEYANLGGMSQVVLGRVTEGDVMLYSGLGMASGVETAVCSNSYAFL